MEIRSAHRLLAKAWSPENFQGDQSLKDAAKEKLKDVNTAYYFLTATSSERSSEERPVYVSQGKASEEQSASSDATLNNEAPALNPNAFSLLPSGDGIKSFAKIWPRLKKPLEIAALVLVVFLTGSIWAGLKAHNPSSAQAANATAPNMRGGANAPQESLLDEIKKDLQTLDPRESAQATDPQADQPAAENVNKARKGKTHGADQNNQAARCIVRPYVTLGDTRDEVLADQGAPTSSSEDTLVYGKSELYFKNGVIAGWRIDPDSSQIRVRIVPEYTINPSPEYFTIGSSRDTVLAVQGTPTTFTEDKCEYDGSIVYFSNNKVVGWKNHSASTPLKAR